MQFFAVSIIKLSYTVQQTTKSLNDIHGNQTISFICVEQLKVETVTTVSILNYQLSSLW